MDGWTASHWIGVLLLGTNVGPLPMHLCACTMGRGGSGSGYTGLTISNSLPSMSSYHPLSYFFLPPFSFLVKINPPGKAVLQYTIISRNAQPRKIKRLSLSPFGCLLFNVQNTGVVIALKCI